MNDYENLSHTTWECKYHVVFIPKYRRKALFGNPRRRRRAHRRQLLCDAPGPVHGEPRPQRVRATGSAGSGDSRKAAIDLRKTPRRATFSRTAQARSEMPVREWSCPICRLTPSASPVEPAGADLAAPQTNTDGGGVAPEESRI
jgi:putative transposase